MGLAEFTIGTATARIDLLDVKGFHAGEWVPRAGGTDDTFGESELADYRQLQHYQNVTTVESIPLALKAADQDGAARFTQELRRTLRLALNYWATDWQDDVVYIAARGECETNARYAAVMRGEVPEDANPFGQWMVQRGPRALMPDLVLVVERGPWMANPPGEGACIVIEGGQDYCYPWFLEFDGDLTELDCGSDAALDNLPDNAISAKGQLTAEAWIRADDYGEGNLGMIFTKTGWYLQVSNAVGLYALVDCATTDAISSCGLDEFSADGLWHHVAMVYDEAGGGTPAARTIYLAIDGVWTASYMTQQASVGNYVVDGAQNLYIGNNAGGTRGFEGGIGWARVSFAILYDPAGGDFTPPARCVIPDVHADAVGQWIKEGTGASVANQAGGTAATAASHTWDCDCDTFYGYHIVGNGNGDEGAGCAERFEYWQAADAASGMAVVCRQDVDGNPVGQEDFEYWQAGEQPMGKGLG